MWLDREQDQRAAHDRLVLRFNYPKGFNPMNEYQYNWVAFWANSHNKVRLIQAKLNDGEIGGEVDRHLARYCEHLETKFPGTKVTYSTEVDRGSCASYLVDLDTNEYLLWAALMEEDCCVV